jgi:hypothetical protein
VQAQSGVYAYNSATNSFFKMKSARVESTAVGPVLRTRTILTYENPYHGTSEASFNFELPETSALAGLGYSTGGDFVVWHVNPDTTAAKGPSQFVDHSSANVYHCSIENLRQGQDLKIYIQTVGMVAISKGRVVAPKPRVDLPIDPHLGNWTLRTVGPASPRVRGSSYQLGMARQMTAVAQKSPNGRTYVVGYIHIPKPISTPIEIESAYYEPADGKGGGKDVTQIVANLVGRGEYFVWASDSIFGDPIQGTHKRLRVVANIEGKKVSESVLENDTMNLLTLTPKSEQPNFQGLQDLTFSYQDPQTVSFSGWAETPGRISAVFNGVKLSTEPRILSPGSDLSRLWSHEVFADTFLSLSPVVEPLPLPG